jgi:hypothetical protein
LGSREGFGAESMNSNRGKGVKGGKDELMDKVIKDSESLKNIVVYLAGSFDAFEAQFTAYEMKLCMDGT